MTLILFGNTLAVMKSTCMYKKYMFINILFCCIKAVLGYRLSSCLVAARVSSNSQFISVALTAGDAGQAEAIFGMVRLFVGTHKKVCTDKFIWNLSRLFIAFALKLACHIGNNIFWVGGWNLVWPEPNQPDWLHRPCDGKESFFVDPSPSLKFHGVSLQPPTTSFLPLRHKQSCWINKPAKKCFIPHF